MVRVRRGHYVDNTGEHTEPSFWLAICSCFARAHLSLHFIQVQLAAGSASVRVMNMHSNPFKERRYSELPREFMQRDANVM